MEFETDEILNQFNEEILSESSDCPWVDDELLKFLIFVFQNQLSFDKNIDFDEYKYRTGIVEVIQFLKDQNKIQKERK